MPAPVTPIAAKLTAFVSNNCRACQRFLNLLAHAPHVLVATRIRVLETDPEANVMMHDLGGYMAPGLLIEHPDGRREFKQGPTAASALINLA